MKVLVFFVLFIGYVSARGSGPYLPRGWKPDGPAFFLPSEITKPSTSSAQESFIDDIETSGSDALKEYGPPKLELFVNVNQALPDVSTEQAFFVKVKKEGTTVSAKEDINIDKQLIDLVEVISTTTNSEVIESMQAVSEQATKQANAQEEQLHVETTELSNLQAQELLNVDNTERFDVQPTTEISVSNIPQLEVGSNLILSKELKEKAVLPAPVDREEIIVPTTVVEELVVLEEKVKEPIDFTSAVPIAVVEQLVIPQVKLENSVLTSVEEVSREGKLRDSVPTPAEDKISEKVEVGVNNIADALVDLEKELKTSQDKAVENVADNISSLVTSGFLDQAPEGFLEYGPPGFTEYGPPKEDSLGQLIVDVVSENSVVNNEVRRRRFSPKIRLTRKH